MTDGNRGDEPATLGAFGYFAAIVLCCLIVGGISFGLGGENERRYVAPASYAKAAKIDAQSACIGRDGTAAFECVYEKVEAAQEQARAEQDLNAQQKAANSALISALVGFFTLIISAVGVWFIKRTLDATLKAVEDTSKATIAMQEANGIAKKQFEMAFTPVLEIEAVGPFVDALDLPSKLAAKGDSIKIRMKIRIKNIGEARAVLEGLMWKPLLEHRPRVDGIQIYEHLHSGEAVWIHSFGCEKNSTNQGIEYSIHITEENHSKLMNHPPPFIGALYYSTPLGVNRVAGFGFKQPKLWLNEAKRWGGNHYNFDETFEEYSKRPPL